MDNERKKQVGYIREWWGFEPNEEPSSSASEGPVIEPLLTVHTEKADPHLLYRNQYFP